MFAIFVIFYFCVLYVNWKNMFFHLCLVISLRHNFLFAKKLHACSGSTEKDSSIYSGVSYENYSVYV